jgi:ABC-type multidrug transport system ATPase subunit
VTTKNTSGPKKAEPSDKLRPWFDKNVARFNNSQFEALARISVMKPNEILLV